MLRPRDVARALNVSRSLVYELVEKGRLPHHRVGVGRGAIRISENDVAEFLRSCRSDTREVNGKSVKRSPRRKLRHLKG